MQTCGSSAVLHFVLISIALYTKISFARGQALEDIFLILQIKIPVE
jgi:hypothetical protein